MKETIFGLRKELAARPMAESRRDVSSDNRMQESAVSASTSSHYAYPFTVPSLTFQGSPSSSGRPAASDSTSQRTDIWRHQLPAAQYQPSYQVDNSFPTFVEQPQANFVGQRRKADMPDFSLWHRYPQLPVFATQLGYMDVPYDRRSYPQVSDATSFQSAFGDYSKEAMLDLMVQPITPLAMP